jgi:SWI/SNF-related matrix-associated actin-dependent regulator 1 of chromatin subfamily A
LIVWYVLKTTKQKDKMETIEKVSYTAKSGRTQEYHVIGREVRFKSVPYLHLQAPDKSFDFWTPERLCERVGTIDPAPAPTLSSPLQLRDGVALFNHQIAGVAHLLAPGTRYLADDMGLGKTLQAIVAADQILATQIGVVLVVCPASVRLNWEREIERFSIQPERYSVVSYSSLKIETFNVPTILILDEAHFIKNPESRRSDTCQVLAQKAMKVFMLSGTPMTRSAQDLYVPCLLAGTTKHSYRSWSHLYCNERTINLKDGRTVTNFEGCARPSEVKQHLNQFMLIRKKSEVLNLPSKIRSTIPIKISKKLADESRRLMAEIQIYDANGTQVNATTREAFATVRRAVGTSKVKGALEFIKEKFDDTEEQCVIFAYHIDVITELAEGLDSFVMVHGGTPQEKRQEAVDAFQSKKVKYFLGNVIAAGTGITLTAASNAVFVEMSVTPTENWQAEDRIHRIGQKETCNYYYLNGQDSFDDQFFKLVDRKGEDIANVTGRE